MFDPLQIPHVFRARSVQPSGSDRIRTGFASLDQALGGGWMHPALIEILIDTYGIGELQLLVPLLRELIARPPQPALVLWLNPPYEPNAVALAQHQLFAHHWLARQLPERDALWSAERSLRSHACSALLAWANTPSTTALRRLKLASTESNAIGILFRPREASAHASPATMRLALKSAGLKLSVEVLKCQGCQPATAVIDIPDHDAAQVTP